jgi:ribosomal protein L11 methylase PrmA
MDDANTDAGSYRDFRGRVYHAGDRIFRTIMPVAVDDFDYVRSTGLIDKLIAAEKLVPEQLVDRQVLGDAASDAAYVLEHPRLPFVSYPYEWPFSILKSAALLHLDIHLDALEHGVTMSDASAYNVQFRGARPVFIDSLSFCRYHEGDFWLGHRQFCEQFINPLLLRSCLGVPHNSWYRGSLEGISTEELSDLLRWRHKLSWNVLTNVVLQARLQRSSSSQSNASQRFREKRLPLIGFQQILHSLRRWIQTLQPKDRKTIWQSYPEQNSYSNDEVVRKREFIGDFASRTQPGMLWDIGCNTGDYSSLALEAGAKYVVGFDFDQGALEQAVARSGRAKLNFLPLYLDAVNPSPNQGWTQSERPGMAQRGPADAALALAVVHHLAISEGVPLDLIIDWIVSLAREGVIEFVQKEDPMVQQLLQLRTDRFEYDQQTFESILSRRARIVRSAQVSRSGRTLYWFSRD